VTVLEAIQKSADFLAKKNVESARLQAELLLAHQLKMPRMKLYLNFDRQLTAAETDGLRELVKRRAALEPLQHIVGSTSFCGFEIAINRHALVPRPETELLAELGGKFLSAINHQLPIALDFGTGTGCISIALAAKCPHAKIVALDISANALALAKQNAAANKVSERIEFLQSDGFETVGRTSSLSQIEKEKLETGKMPVRQFDLLISNPPYIASAEIEALEPEVRDFDPRAALDGGADGLDFYRLLATQAKPFLKTDGKIMLEFGDGQAEAIRKIFENEKWIVEAVQADYSQRERILIAKQ
jgi:release factor glutamine methyltransferase